MRLVEIYNQERKLAADSLKRTTKIGEHQQRVKDKLEKSGAVLAYHGMGSGKTLTSIYSTLGSNPDVIVPASLRTNYQKEIDKHTRSGKHSANVMSYEKAIKTEPKSRSVVLDEIQAIGHAETDRSRFIVDKASHYEKMLLLSGTPIRNHPSELAPIVNMMKGAPVLPKDKKEFEKKFIEPVMTKPNLIQRVVMGSRPMQTGSRIKNEKELEDILRGHVDYHMPSKEDYPSVSHSTIRVEMSKEQQKLYDFALQKLKNPVLAYKIRKGLPPSKQEAKELNAFMAATRQISNTGRSHGGKEVGSPKLNRAVDELMARHAKDPNFKGMVYSNYLGSGLTAYQDRLKDKGLNSEIFDGTLSDKKRQEMVDRYNQGKTKALLVSGAGAQGLDLKGTKLVQILEPHWNSARIEQAQARAIRYKSHAHLPEDERNVEVQRFHSTLRPGLLARLGRKIVGPPSPDKKGKDMSADEYLDKMNRDKDELNQQFLNVLKKVGSE